MKKITFLFLLMMSVVAYGQVSLDFEDGTTTTQFNFNGVGSGNIANPQSNADNMSTRVLEVTKPSGSAWFAGCGFQEAPGVAFVNMADGDQFTVKIWSTKANVPFRVRLQADLDGVANTAYNFDFTVMTANQWIEYTLDFSSQVNGTEQYREIVIQPDYDPSCEGGGCPDIATGGTYYIDDFVQVGAMVDPNTDASLSDLTLDGMTVAGFSANTLTYDVELPNGTMTAPTVAGVATQAGMGSSNVSVTQASGVPGSATLDVTAPNGTDMQTYTVNFTEAAALPPPAPTPPSIPAISILSDVFANVTVPQVDVFGGVLTNLDLNSDTNEEARSLVGGSGFQFNFFAGTFLDASPAGMLHLDIYNDNFQVSDVLTIRLIGSDNRQNIHRITGFDPADNGTWISIDLQLPNGDPASTDRGDFDEPDSDANSIDLSSVGLIQFNTLENGSSLGTREFFLSNFYFFGGSLSTPEFNLEASFKALPNPTKDNWTISANNTIITSVEVYDILGKKVKSIKANSQTIEVDASSLNDGIYIAKVSSDAGSKTIKLVKN